MQQKTLLLASFINKERVDYFLNKIKNKFGIEKEQVFFFDLQTDEYLG